MSWFIRWHGYPDWSVHWAQQTKQHQNGGGAGTQGGKQNPRMISTVRKTYRDQYIWTSSCLQTGLSATFFLGRLIRRPAFGSWTWLPHNSNLFGPGINREGTKKPVCAVDFWSLAQSGSLPWYGWPSGGQHRIGRGWDPDMAYPWWTVGQMDRQEKSKVQRQKRQRNSEKNTHQRAVVPTWFQHGSNMVPTWFQRKALEFPFLAIQHRAKSVLAAQAEVLEKKTLPRQLPAEKASPKWLKSKSSDNTQSVWDVQGPRSRYQLLAKDSHPVSGTDPQPPLIIPAIATVCEVGPFLGNGPVPLHCRAQKGSL